MMRAYVVRCHGDSSDRMRGRRPTTEDRFPAERTLSADYGRLFFAAEPILERRLQKVVRCGAPTTEGCFPAERTLSVDYRRLFAAEPILSAFLAASEHRASGTTLESDEGRPCERHGGTLTSMEVATNNG
jgi:hypothetical protein